MGSYIRLISSLKSDSCRALALRSGSLGHLCVGDGISVLRFSGRAII